MAMNITVDKDSTRTALNSRARCLEHHAVKEHKRRYGNSDYIWTTLECA